MKEYTHHREQRLPRRIAHAPRGSGGHQRIYVLKAELEALEGRDTRSFRQRTGRRRHGYKVRIAEEKRAVPEGIQDSIQSLLQSGRGHQRRRSTLPRTGTGRPSRACQAEAKTSLLLLQSPDFSRQESIARNNSRIAQIEAEMKVLEERKGFFSVVSPMKVADP